MHDDASKLSTVKIPAPYLRITPFFHSDKLNSASWLLLCSMMYLISPEPKLWHSMTALWGLPEPEQGGGPQTPLTLGFLAVISLEIAFI
jgi:hypothetical protein